MNLVYAPLKGMIKRTGMLFDKMPRKVNLNTSPVTSLLGTTLICDESLASTSSQLTRNVAGEFGFMDLQAWENLTQLERHLVMFSSRPNQSGGTDTNIRRQLCWTTLTLEF